MIRFAPFESEGRTKGLMAGFAAALCFDFNCAQKNISYNGISSLSAYYLSEMLYNQNRFFLCGFLFYGVRLPNV